MNSHSKSCGCRGFDPHRKQSFLLLMLIFVWLVCLQELLISRKEAVERKIKGYVEARRVDGKPASERVQLASF